MRTFREIVPDMDLVHAKREVMTRLCHSGAGNQTTSNIPELREPSEPIALQKQKKNTKKALRSSSHSLQDSDHKPYVSAAMAGGNPLTPLAPSGNQKVSSWSYEMFGHVHQTVDKYLELSGKTKESLNIKAATPCIDDH